MVVVGMLPDPGLIPLNASMTAGLTNLAAQIMGQGTKIQMGFMKSSMDAAKWTQSFGMNMTKWGNDFKMTTMKNTKDLIFQDKVREAQQKAEDAKKEKNWWAKFLDGKGKWIKDVGQKIVQFNKFMLMIARFAPIIKVFLVIIIIFSNLLFYVIMLIAWIGAAILEVIYFIISLAPFIHILWFIFFVVTDGLPFILYTMVFLALLVILTIFCAIVAFLDVIFNGKLKSLILCQNSPASWYKVPSFHMYNKFERGLFCSKPCRKAYYPDETGQSCVKLPKGNPPYCPQAQIMRFYSGDGKKDKKYFYSDMKTKSNLKYLSKSPASREDALLDHYLNRKKFMEDCNNPNNPVGMSKYNHLTMSICANIDAMANSDVGKYKPELIKKLRKICNQSFCDSKSTFPFCTKLSTSSESSCGDILRKVILAIISLIVFAITVIFIFAYLNED